MLNRWHYITFGIFVIIAFGIGLSFRPEWIGTPPHPVEFRHLPDGFYEKELFSYGFMVRKEGGPTIWVAPYSGNHTSQLPDAFELRDGKPYEVHPIDVRKENKVVAKKPVPPPVWRPLDSAPQESSDEVLLLTYDEYNIPYVYTARYRPAGDVPGYLVYTGPGWYGWQAGKCKKVEGNPMYWLPFPTFKPEK